MMEIVTILLLGLAAGLTAGVLGIGGGIIVIPGLVYFLGYTQKAAQGTSLAMLLPPIGLLAAINYYNAGYVNVKAAGLLIITFIIGSYISSKFAVTLPENVIKKIFATFLLFYAIKLFIEK